MSTDVYGSEIMTAAFVMNDTVTIDQVQNNYTANSYKQ